MKAVLLAIVLVGCAAPEAPPSIDHARPPWGPTSGGTSITLFGDGFDPHVNRVFIAGREAPVVRTIDDGRLEVVVPPGERPGDAEVVVVTAGENAIATGVFRYSEAPAIETVTPPRVLVSSSTTRVSIIGRGFLDEEAGDPVVLVDGQPIPEATVLDDSTITFLAPPGVAFTRPNIDVINRRGTARAPGYRYSLGDRPGVFLYASSGDDEFGWFYEPASAELITVPRAGSSRPCIYAAMTDGNGDHVVSVFCTPFPYAYARMDFESQQAVDLVPTNLYFAMTRHAGRNYGIDLNTRRFGSFPDTGAPFEPISETSFNSGQVGLASDRDTLWMAGRDPSLIPSISTIDPETGARGTTIALSPAVDVYDMVALDGVLYATTSASELVSIDPATGVVTTLAPLEGQSLAMDVVSDN